MRIMKKPLFAFFFCLVVVFVSTIVSVHAKLDFRCGEISDRFRESGGIAAQLSTVCDNSAGIVKLAEDNGIDASEAERLVSNLRGALSSESPSRLFSRYQLLTSAVHSLKISLRQAELSDADAAVLGTLTADLDTAQAAIDGNDYNRTVGSFLRKELGSFSVTVARLCGVQLPEQFA